MNHHLPASGDVCRFAGVIFDLDGTLLDSMDVWSRIDEEFLADYGIAVPPDYMAACGALSFRETAEYTIARFSLPARPEELMQRWLDMAREEYACRVPLKPGARALLEKLKASGVRLAAATASRREHFEPCLARCGVLSLFDALVTTEDAGCGKNSSDVFVLTSERLGLAPERCAVFEDTCPAAKSAAAAGCTPFGVYDRHSAGSRDEMERICRGYFESLEEACVSGLVWECE